MDTKKLVEQAQRRYPSANAATMTSGEDSADQLMLLTASTSAAMRLVRIPSDFEPHEAFRRVTGLIAAVEEEDPDYDWQDLQAILEDQGFETIEFVVGPSLD